MYRVVLYEDAHGNSPVDEALKELDQKAINDKNSRVTLKRITFRIGLLERLGTRAGEYITKHIRNDIWELRAGRNRIMFFAWKDNIFVLLHVFCKVTMKTPKSEIEKAERELNDWVDRHGH